MSAIMYEADTAQNTVIRVVPALASEIGFQESVVLLQIEYWIRTARDYVDGQPVTGIERDGQFWTYQSTASMREKAFPFWSESTINRAIKNLKDAGYIRISTDYNRKNYDRTRWFSLNYEVLATLQSVNFASMVAHSTQDGGRSTQDGGRSTQDGGRSTQDGGRSTQDGGPIPEISSEIFSEMDTETSSSEIHTAVDDGSFLECETGEYIPEAEPIMQSDDRDDNRDSLPEPERRERYPAYALLRDFNVLSGVAWQYRNEKADRVQAFIREAKHNEQLRSPVGWVVSCLKRGEETPPDPYASQYCLGREDFSDRIRS